MARRRKNILDSAIELFHERGFLGTTVDDIAAKAGVTKRTLYHHMGNKDNILSEIHSDFIAIGLSRWQGIREAGGTPTETLRSLIREHILIVFEHRAAIAVFFDESKHVRGSARDEVFAARQEYEEILRRTILDGVRSGEFRAELDVRVTTRIVLGGLTEIYRWCDPTSPKSREPLIALATELVLDGVLPDTDRESA